MRLVQGLPPCRLREALLWRTWKLGYELFNATTQANPHVLMPDVRLVEPDDVLGEGVTCGREAVIRSSRKSFETWDEFRVDPEQLVVPQLL